MKSKTSKIIHNDPVITQSILKKEMGRIEDQLDGVTQAIQTIIKELGNMRKENREFYQMREQLYTNDLIQERKLDDHETRLHVLEIA